MKHNGMEFDNYFDLYPNEAGYFGPYGGVYVADGLKAAIAEITEAYMTIGRSDAFLNELSRIRREFQGRPTPVSGKGGARERADVGITMPTKHSGLCDAVNRRRE